MAKESKIKNILLELLQSGFFSEWKTPSDVIKKLSQRGLTIKGRKVGMVCTTLTKMCQDPTTGLEREEIPKEKRIGGEKWRFKKAR
jgi:hypothetical protein